MKSINLNILFFKTEVALKSLFTDNKGIAVYAKTVISLESNKTNIITSDILFLFLQLIELFPTNIVHYIKSIKVNQINTIKKI